MGWWFFGIFLGLVALGVEGYPAKDLVLRLPGQPKVDFKQFVGYVDVDEKAGRSLFYYLVEQLGMLIRTPYGLTLWLNGGNDRRISTHYKKGQISERWMYRVKFQREKG